MNTAPNLGRWGNRLLAALPRETLAMLEPDLKQVSLSQGVVCFSNRPVWVKRFQTVHGGGFEVTRGLVLLYGIGT